MIYTVYKDLILVIPIIFLAVNWLFQELGILPWQKMLKLR